MDSHKKDDPSLVFALVVGGLIGGITAAVLSSPQRRQQILKVMHSIDERTLEIRPYITKRIAEYGHAIESEMKTSARKLMDEVETPPRVTH